MARRYRMTPKRRAALAKAQAASARKRKSSRRRTIAKRAAGGLTIVSLVGAGYKAGSYYRAGASLTHVNQLRPSSFYSTSKAIDVVRVTPTRSGQNWQHVGKPVQRNVVQRRIKKPKPKARPKYHVFKVDKQGKTTSTTVGRMMYDRRRRAGLVKGYEKKKRRR